MLSKPTHVRMGNQIAFTSTAHSNVTQYTQELINFLANVAGQRFETADGSFRTRFQP